MTLGNLELNTIVAPLAGAWIETSIPRYVRAAVRVAPLAGAWIETLTDISIKRVHRSRPSRARGLKPAFRH